MPEVIVNTVVPIVHVLACLFLIVVVLLQTGKGADMGAVFGGGGSQTLFGATGAGNLLTKLTAAMAVTFMITSLTLALSQSKQPTSGLLDQLPEAGVALPAPPPPVASDEAPADVATPAADTAPPAVDVATDAVDAAAEAAAPAEEAAPAAVPTEAAPADAAEPPPSP